MKGFMLFCGVVLVALLSGFSVKAQTIDGRWERVPDKPAPTADFPQQVEIEQHADRTVIRENSSKVDLQSPHTPTDSTNVVFRVQDTQGRPTGRGSFEMKGTDVLRGSIEKNNRVMNAEYRRLNWECVSAEPGHGKGHRYATKPDNSACVWAKIAD